MKFDGYTYQYIANEFGVSKQRVHQMLSNVVTPRLISPRLKFCQYINVARVMAERHITYKDIDRDLNLWSGKANSVLTGKQKLTVEFANQLGKYLSLSLEEIIEK